ncbi:MAG: hypothetical protein HIU92_02560 [Proteobacteria bacterium]|nr:hypothetical protein [Pseudomonadota bacterium]
MTATRLPPDDGDIGVLLAAEARRKFDILLGAVHSVAIQFAASTATVGDDLFAAALVQAEGIVRDMAKPVSHTVAGSFATEAMVEAFLAKVNEERGRLLEAALCSRRSLI